MDNALAQIGLTKNEARIYRVLLELGKTQVGVLSRKTGVHRRSIYDVLDRLIEKGLVSYMVENEKRFYCAADPKRIKEMMDAQKEAVDKLMPELEATFLQQKNKQETQFYRGVEGIKTIFEEQIEDGHDVCIIGGSHYAWQVLRFYLPQYTKRRVKKKIKLHAIYALPRHKSPVPLADVRYLPESFLSPVATNVYGGKVAIILWSKDPVAIVIKQQDIARTFKHYFDMLWKVAKP